ncbi:MAG: PilZ domain-containing protein, partial [Planctomycetota bacterium]
PIVLAVRYKFLSHVEVEGDLEEVHEGSSQNIGTGGLMLRARVPDPAWLQHLLTRTMYVGVNILLPNQGEALKALCRVAWASAMEEGNHIVFGLSFQEITQESRDMITQYIIRSQMPA